MDDQLINTFRNLIYKLQLIDDEMETSKLYVETNK